MRYSPHPITHYGRRLTVQRVGAPDTFIETGPHTSPLLADDSEAWNLAFLSFPYEKGGYPDDPNFSVHVRRTLQVDVATGAIDITETQQGLRVRLFLRYPPLKAVRLICGLQPHVLRNLPMLSAYGEDWLKTITLRASMLASLEDPDEPVSDLSDAARYLVRFGSDRQT